jgi:hypothetical protein
VECVPVDSRFVQLDRGTCHTWWHRLDLDLVSDESVTGLLQTTHLGPVTGMETSQHLSGACPQWGAGAGAAAAAPISNARKLAYCPDPASDEEFMAVSRSEDRDQQRGSTIDGRMHRLRDANSPPLDAHSILRGNISLAPWWTIRGIED